MRNTFLKRILYSIMMLISIETFGQEYEFIVHEIDPCNKTKSNFSINYYLEKNGVKYKPQLKNGIVKLNLKGEYILINEFETVSVIIDKKKNSYNLNLHRIEEFLVTHDKYGYIFKNCEKPLNGEVVDYFENKKIKLIGTFKKGHAIGFLTEFYSTGKLKKVRLYNKRGFFVKEIFNSNIK